MTQVSYRWITNAVSSPWKGALTWLPEKVPHNLQSPLSRFLHDAPAVRKNLTGAVCDFSLGKTTKCLKNTCITLLCVFFFLCLFSFSFKSRLHIKTSDRTLTSQPPSTPPPHSFFFFPFPASGVRTLHPQMPKIPLCFIWLEDRDEARREGDQGGRVLAFWEDPAQPDKFQTRRWELIKRGGGRGGEAGGRSTVLAWLRFFKAGPVHPVKWRLLKTDDFKFCPPVL